jgi:hypothetical protein
VEVTNKLVNKFWRLEELCSWLEGPGVRICNLLLGSPSSQVRWADRLDEAAVQLEAELAAWHQVDVKLVALQTLVALVWDMVLGNVDGPSSLAASLSMVAKLHNGQIHIVAANGAR